MKQIIMQAPRKSKVCQVDVPKHNDDQILVKVKYSGICHSELFPWQNATNGLILGHESMGYVAEVGKNVTGFKVGDRVTGLGGGAFKEYITMDKDKIMHIPENIADEDAVVEPLGCMMSAGSRMMPKLLDDEIAVVGAGYMGLGMISMFRAMGYGHIVAIDTREEARENAIKFGADIAVSPEEITDDRILNWKTWIEPDLMRNGHKVDIFNIGFHNVMEFSGTPSGLDLAGQLVSAHGRLGIGGYHNDSKREIDFKLWNIKAMDMINCHERRIPFEVELCRRALDLISKDIWLFRGAVNKIYSMDEFDKAQEDVELHRDGYIKGLIKCD